MRPSMVWDRLAALVVRALDSGGTIKSPGAFAWNVSGSCLSPRLVELSGHRLHELADTRRHGFLQFDGAASIFLDMEVPCRKCPNCLDCRCRLWARRAMVELARSERTWFVTLTLRPADRYRVSLEARHACIERGVDFDDLSGEEQFREKHRVIGPEVTKWLKRVRAERDWKEKLATAREQLLNDCGEPQTDAERLFRVQAISRLAAKTRLGPRQGLRVCIVAEVHKDGEPHYHALIHEPDGSFPVTSRTLCDQWTLGFAKAKLVDTSEASRSKTAWYVAKYLAKSCLARVRASIGYGDTTFVIGPSRGTTTNDEAGRLSSLPCQAFGVADDVRVGGLSHSRASGSQAGAGPDCQGLRAGNLGSCAGACTGTGQSPGASHAPATADQAQAPPGRHRERAPPAVAADAPLSG